jgi:hypothetical protein
MRLLHFIVQHTIFKLITWAARISQTKYIGFRDVQRAAICVFGDITMSMPRQGKNSAYVQSSRFSNDEEM